MWEGDSGLNIWPVCLPFHNSVDCYSGLTKGSGRWLRKEEKLVAQSEVQKHIDALKDRERSVRANAARALCEIGPDAKDAVPALIEALNDKDVDLIAVWALGEIGPAARASVLAIAQWLRKAESSCRCNIREQLLCLLGARQKVH